jgi:hypothetical protein
LFSSFSFSPISFSSSNSLIHFIKANYSSIVTSVSFERYNLGPNSSLISDLSNLTDVHSYLSYLGFQTIPMISSYPYPPAFLSWMRQVFSNPTPFLSSLISEAKLWGYAGYCFDWEPTVTPEPQVRVFFFFFFYFSIFFSSIFSFLLLLSPSSISSLTSFRSSLFSSLLCFVYLSHSLSPSFPNCSLLSGRNRLRQFPPTRKHRTSLQWSSCHNSFRCLVSHLELDTPGSD